MTTLAPTQLDTLVAAVRHAVGRHHGWRETAEQVADALRLHLPAPSVLTPEQRSSPGGHVLHVEPDGSFSMVGIVWEPGKVTSIHDHLTWCVFGVLQGIEQEDLYTLDEDGTSLIEVGRNANLTREVSGFAPPGDIHRVRNDTGETAISLHIYGTDLSRIGSSVRRTYDLPVRRLG
jgi:predicted metal-dependent enzyme (double-stranded beta helix superfamily)